MQSRRFKKNLRKSWFTKTAHISRNLNFKVDKKFGNIATDYFSRLFNSHSNHCFAFATCYLVPFVLQYLTITFDQVLGIFQYIITLHHPLCFVHDVGVSSVSFWNIGVFMWWRSLLFMNGSWWVPNIYGLVL